MNLSPQDEPARLTGLIVGVASAIVALILYFVPLSAATQGYIKDAIILVAPAVAGFIIRRFVTPASKVVVQKP